MNTLILTGSDKAMHELLDLTIPSKQKYASKHNYDFMCMRSFPSDTQCGFEEEKHVGFLRATTAFKLLRFYDAVMWIDGDSVVTNFDYKIEDFLKPDVCFTASHDWFAYSLLSSGNFIVQKTKDTQQFFDIFLQIGKQRIDAPCQEQGTLNLMHRSIPAVRHLFNVLPHKFLGAVPSFLVNTKSWIERNNTRVGRIVEPWNKDCFLAHLTGISNEDRIDIIKNNMLAL
jgi:hypothetical protein